MACKPNEMAILKSTSVKLDDDTLLILSYNYHTEKGDKSKSKYQYYGRIAKISDLENEITKFRETKDENWKYPLIDGYFLGYANGHTNACGAKWLENKINKALKTWDEFIKLVKDGIKIRSDGVEKQSNNAKYDLDDYVLEDGTPFSIRCQEDCLKHIGKYFYKDIILKTQLTA